MASRSPRPVEFHTLLPDFSRTRPVCRHQRKSDTYPHCASVAQPPRWIWICQRRARRRIGTATVAARLAQKAHARREASGDMRRGRHPFRLDMLLILTAQIPNVSERAVRLWLSYAAQASLTNSFLHQFQEVFTPQLRSTPFINTRSISFSGSCLQQPFGLGGRTHPSTFNVCSTRLCFFFFTYSTK